MRGNQVGISSLKGLNKVGLIRSVSFGAGNLVKPSSFWHWGFFPDRTRSCPLSLKCSVAENKTQI